MKRNAKRTGSGRLRLGLLLASAAALLLVPAMAANAATSEATIEISGEGSGSVVGDPGPLEGTPPINCHWNGETEEATGVCKAVIGEASGLFGVAVEHVADSGSEFFYDAEAEEFGWELEGASSLGGSCGPGNKICGAVAFSDSPFTIKATFEPEPATYALNLTTSGTGSGSFQCNTGSGPEACEAEYVEGTVVTVTANPDTGSELGTVSGTGSAAACAASPCTVTMTEEGSINAEFNLETFGFSTTVIGEGTVQCDSGGGLGACAASYTYFDEVEVVATPNGVEFVLAEISGTEDAAGCTASPCTFTIDGPGASSVTAEFKTAAFKEEAPVNVHGEVLETTTLEAAGCADVDLGIFDPGKTWDYTNTCPVTLTSTGAETKLTVEDESATNTGHLVQGSYFLPSVLQAAATDSEAKGTSAGLVDLNETPGAVTLLTFGVPIAKDAATLEFSQHIDENDGLHHGVYSKTITLTLEQTA